MSKEVEITINCVDKTPIEMMYEVLNSERYQAIQI